jgi:hypothetical protein
MGPEVTGREVPEDPLGEKVKEKIDTWINTCLQCHEYCRRTGDSPFPTRLLNVTYDSPKLENTAGKVGNYAALSHCWGGHNSLTTTVSTISYWENGTSMTELPLTIRDAVDLTRKLDIPYLWADTLCIIQDDPLDGEKKAARMGQVYTMSFLTISAMSATNSNDGFLTLRIGGNVEKALGSFPYTDPKTGNECELYLRHDNGGWKQAVENGILNTRAWVLQERILSPRIIHFSKSRMFWKCFHWADAEGGINPAERYGSDGVGLEGRLLKNSMPDFATNIALNASGGISSENCMPRTTQESLKPTKQKATVAKPEKPTVINTKLGLQPDRIIDIDLDDRDEESKRSSSGQILLSRLDSGKGPQQPAISDSEINAKGFTQAAIDRGAVKMHPVEKLERKKGDDYELWQEVVDMYSSRKLTFVKDKFPALLSIISHVHQRIHAKDFSFEQRNALQELAFSPSRLDYFRCGAL